MCASQWILFPLCKPCVCWCFGTHRKRGGRFPNVIIRFYLFLDDVISFFFFFGPSSSFRAIFFYYYYFSFPMWIIMLFIAYLFFGDGVKRTSRLWWEQEQLKWDEISVDTRVNAFVSGRDETYSICSRLHCRSVADVFSLHFFESLFPPCSLTLVLAVHNCTSWHVSWFSLLLRLATV